VAHLADATIVVASPGFQGRTLSGFVKGFSVALWAFVKASCPERVPKKPSSAAVAQRSCHRALQRCDNQRQGLNAPRYFHVWQIRALRSASRIVHDCRLAAIRKPCTWRADLWSPRTSDRVRQMLGHLIAASRVASSRPLFGLLGLPPMMFDPRWKRPAQIEP
jgi:hypothetical protein